MAHHHFVPKTYHTAIGAHEPVLGVASGDTILALMLLAVAQILGRLPFIGASVPGFIDFVEQFMAIFAFLGIAYCQRLGGHIRMDILVRRLKGRGLWATEWITTFLMLLLTVPLTWGSWLHFRRALDIGDSSMDIALPLWPAKLMVPVALAILAVRLAIQLWGYGRAMTQAGGNRPVAVPMIESAAEQAAEEARHVSGPATARETD